MIAFLLANRTVAEILSVLGLLVSIGLGWHFHNTSEQRTGAQACIAATTTTKASAVADNSSIEAAHAAQLSKVVAVYESKLSTSALAAAGLDERLRNYRLRQSAVPHGCPAAGAARGTGAIPVGNSGPERAADPLDGAIQALIEACSADALELTALQAAYPR